MLRYLLGSFRPSEEIGEEKDSNHHEDQGHLDRRAHGQTQPGADACPTCLFQVAVQAPLAQDSADEGTDQDSSDAEEQPDERPKRRAGGSTRAAPDFLAPRTPAVKSAA